MKRNLASQDLARRMRAQGILLDIPEDDSEGRRLASGLFMAQNGECLVIPIDRAQSAYIFDVHIVSNFAWPFSIEKVEVRFPWGQVPINWLPEPDDNDIQGAGYRFPGENPLEFERSVAINRYVGSHRKLRRGDVVSGLLLGTGERIPEDAGPNPAPALLYVYDQFDQKYETQISVFSIGRKLVRAAGERSGSRCSSALTRKIRQ